uniref:Melanoma antigen preferentially expressed in tumors-like n=1 Tax=Rhinolophus ferrumequinum TaxID=59479 RepID=A0A671DK70_RHIFE
MEDDLQLQIRFIKMDQKATATLLELAAKSLLSNEPAAIHALEELPRDLFVPLFIAAFLGGHMKVLKEMVSIWPFHCLHIGTLSREESYYEILEAMIDGLQILPAQNSSTCGPKLRILDLMEDQDCETTCPSIRKTFPFLEEAQRNVRCLGIGNSESEPLSAWKPTEVLVDLSISGNLKKKQFLSFLQNKVEENIGSLHLCCRGLHIDSMPAVKSVLQFLDLGCTDHLEVYKADLSEVTTHFAQMTHLNSLSLSNIPFKSCKGRKFNTFLTWLGHQDNLQDLILCSFCLKNQLHKLLRVLPPRLDTLYLTFCGLSNRDVIALSQSSQATHLTQLNLSNNQIFSEVYEPFQTLLEKASGTLQHLEVNNCLITDSILSALLPALSHCSHLRILSFASNPITMPVLRSLLQHLTSLTKLKYVIYPVPVHCYEQEDFHSTLDQQKLAEVQAQLKVMLHAVQRDDMNWTTSPE